ncbi:hypothetical protein AX15_006987 [Amanita polypyramis BW_CC]|nr:hypothetical protein AX15_006987 [Amanita polypyramis BW_CC]
MATEGLLQWANAVRSTMATDPGRALFKEQVQTHGFSFLDGYLDNILSNAKQDALIELVKTPGRKKTLTKKPKLPYKPKEGIALFSEDEGHCQTVPQDSANNGKVTHPISGYHQSTEELSMQTLQAKASNTVLAELISYDPLPVSTATCPTMTDSWHSPHSETKELSIIAEDDETAERSCVSLPVDSTVMQIVQAEEGCTTVNPGNGGRFWTNTQSTFSNGNGADQQASSDKTHDDRRSAEVDASGSIHTPSTNDPDSVRRSYGMVENRGSNEQVISEPLFSIEDGAGRAADVVVPLRDPDSTPPSPKPNDAPFPPLPMVAPLHKSIRTAENSTAIGSSGAVTPGIPVTGKRTSWLQKVRQAKAMEIAGKKTASISSTGSSLHPSSTILLASAKRKSTEAFNGSTEDDEERRHKVAKTTEADTVAMSGSNSNLIADATSTTPLGWVEPTSPLPSEVPLQEKQFVEGGMLDLLKKRVEGLGAHAGKSMGKSLGGSAATALAEARAAAEARIAERNEKENETVTMVHYTASGYSNEKNEEQVFPSKSGPSVPGQSSNPSGTADPVPTVTPLGVSNHSFQPTPVPNTTEIAQGYERQSIVSTTPPSTPPTVKDVFIPPPGPVFNKPPPVFIPPTKSMKDVADNQIEKHNLRSTSKSSMSTHLPSPSDVIFDNDRNPPAWMSSAQDTYAHSQNTNVCDEDDSWPIDEKFSEGVHWIYGDAKDDNTTWSSLPSQQNTANLSQRSTPEQAPSETQFYPTEEHIGVAPDMFDIDMNQKNINVQDETSDSEIEEVTQNATMSTVSLVDLSKSQSQMSNTSSASIHQSQLGFFGQATKLIGNMMGSGKKAKPEVQKVLQKAAIAAKKQQEESDKKAARLKEMENRRQLAIQRKVEEEKTRVIEQEKKIKEENERRKRDREEHTDKRPLKAPSSRKDDDTAKRRKIEAEKKAEQTNALSSSAAYNSSLNTNGVPAHGTRSTEAKSIKSNTSLTAKAKGKVPTKAPTTEEDLRQPSQIVQTQMAARAKAQLQAAKQAQDPPVVPSESIELPDINSEYSDSEDEDRQRTFDPPDWAQSPELKQALQQQSTINPDDIFGAIRPLKMEEIFKTRTSRFRARTSSANWGGTDRLTVEEEREYARRMGFK